MSEHGLIIFLPDLNIVSEQALIKFFGLSTAQYAHCFVAYSSQVKKFLGKPLHALSTPSDISYNIHCLLGLVLPNYSRRMVLIEKTPAQNF